MTLQICYTIVNFYYLSMIQVCDIYSLLRLAVPPLSTWGFKFSQILTILPTHAMNYNQSYKESPGKVAWCATT